VLLDPLALITQAFPAVMEDLLHLLMPLQQLILFGLEVVRAAQRVHRALLEAQVVLFLTEQAVRAVRAVTVVQAVLAVAALVDIQALVV
jgi:hypothetical protein